MLKSLGKITLLCFGILLFIVALIFILLLLTGWPHLNNYILDTDANNNEIIGFFAALGTTIFLFTLAYFCVRGATKRTEKLEEKTTVPSNKDEAKLVHLEIGSIENGLRNALLGFGTLLLISNFLMFLMSFNRTVINVLEYGYEDPVFSEVLGMAMTAILDFLKNFGIGLLCLFAAHKIKPIGDKK